MNFRSSSVLSFKDRLLTELMLVDAVVVDVGVWPDRIFCVVGPRSACDLFVLVLGVAYLRKLRCHVSVLETSSHVLVGWISSPYTSPAISHFNLTCFIFSYFCTNGTCSIRFALAIGVRVFGFLWHLVIELLILRDCLSV